MTPEEQLINDILVIEEKIMYEKDYDNPQQSNINKLHARRLRAVEQYAKEQNRSIAFKAWFSGMQQGVIFDHNDRKELWEKETKRMTFDEWYDQFKQQ